MKIKIILSAIIFASALSFAANVCAAASLNISPSSATLNVGDILNLSAELSADASQVCAVEGRLVFDNLACQNIVLSDDVAPQASPTCLDPYFLLGFPGCSSLDKALFSLSVKADSADTASLTFSDVDIIGQGVSLGDSSTGGSYTINAVPLPLSEPVAVSEPVLPQTDQTIAEPEEQFLPEQSSEPAPLPAVETNQPAALAESSSPLSVGSASLFSSIGDFVKTPIVIIILVLCAILLGWRLIDKFVLKKEVK